MADKPSHPRLSRDAPGSRRMRRGESLLVHVMIRRDAGAAAVTETLVRAGRALTVEISQVPGFVSHAAFTTDDGALVSISICEDAAGLEAIGSLLTGWLSVNMPEARQQPEVVAGEIIMQRGL